MMDTLKGLSLKVKVAGPNNFLRQNADLQDRKKGMDLFVLLGLPYIRNSTRLFENCPFPHTQG